MPTATPASFGSSSCGDETRFLSHVCSFAGWLFKYSYWLLSCRNVAAQFLWHLVFFFCHTMPTNKELAERIASLQALLDDKLDGTINALAEKSKTKIENLGLGESQAI